MSERLTMFTPYGYVGCDPIDVCQNEYSPENFKKILTKLGRYEDLEEQGRLIELPCKPREYVWVADKYGRCRAQFPSNAAIVNAIENGDGIGKTIEDAEANFKGVAVLRGFPKRIEDAIKKSSRIVNDKAGEQE